MFRNMHRQIHDPNPRQCWIPLITFTDDPSIPLRNTRGRLQFSADRIKPARALLLRAQGNGLQALWVLLVGAHVDVEGQVVADAGGHTMGFDN